MNTLLKAKQKAGYRELYAMQNATCRQRKVDGTHILYVFTYGKDKEYQDANGATWDATTERWIN